MTVEAIPVTPAWLDLREGADAAARCQELISHLCPRLREGEGLVIHDLGSGSGSMGRWLAPLLPGRQHWVLHDRDADLLTIAAYDAPGPAADGSPVTVETRLSDVTRLRRDELAGAALITASALLDLLTGDELERLVHACARPGCPVLLTLSVIGRVQWRPPDPLDSLIQASFNAHQRRDTPRGRLLGPDAAEAAADAFRRLGAEVIVGPSPWHLGASDTGLGVAWLDGWLGAACEQQPALAAEAGHYARRRLGEAEAGCLDVTIDHADLLVLP